MTESEYTRHMFTEARPLYLCLLPVRPVCACVHTSVACIAGNWYWRLPNIYIYKQKQKVHDTYDTRHILSQTGTTLVPESVQRVAAPDPGALHHTESG